jgi:hypothetical protein
MLQRTCRGLGCVTGAFGASAWSMERRLPIDAEHPCAVDAGFSAVSEWPHDSVDQGVLLRRVRVGG